LHTRVSFHLRVGCLPESSLWYTNADILGELNGREKKNRVCADIRHTKVYSV